MKAMKFRRVAKRLTVIILLTLVILIIIAALTGCGNRQFLDTTYHFNKAIVAWPDGSTKEIQIQSWADYEGEQLQIKAKDGTSYLVSSFNTVLVSE